MKDSAKYTMRAFNWAKVQQLARLINKSRHKKPTIQKIIVMSVEHAIGVEKQFNVTYQLETTYCAVYYNAKRLWPC